MDARKKKRRRRDIKMKVTHPDVREGMYSVVIESPRSAVGPGRLYFLCEDDVPLRFADIKEARDAVRGAMWEHKWLWWIVCLEDGGRVRYGQR